MSTRSVKAFPLTVGIIGDSTVCDYPDSSSMRGWGQMLRIFLPPLTTIINEARGGESSKTFPACRWSKVLDAKTDCVLIQFGHNDSHAKEQPESTDAATDYRSNLCRYVREAREAGVTPVLVTPVRRRLFCNGVVTSELQPYAEAMKVVAAEQGVLLIDLHEASGALYSQLGEEGCASFTVNATDYADRPGADDRTHFTPKGAEEIARLVAAEMANFNIGPRNPLRPS